MSYLAPTWQTERLVVRDGTLAEVAELREVFNSCHSVEKWDPTFILVPLAEMTELVTKSVNAPPDGEMQFRLQAARVQGDERIIGYFHTYQRHPHADVALISMMVMRADRQGGGYGRELVEGLWQQFSALGWCRAVWLSVYLKNWPALRFWINQGFTKIIDYDGDRIHSETTHADIVVEKAL
jgi:ribosomal protein S18 acetylase RimI-like enzyme